MTNKIIFKLSLLFFLISSNSVFAQKAVIIKDSVKYESEQLVLEEFKMGSSTKEAISIQIQIQNANAVFGSKELQSPEERLKSKKDSLLYYIKNDELRKANYGFEHFEILFENKDLINLSILLQSFGSPFELRQFLAFDFTTGKRIDETYFQDKKQLQKKIQSKLKAQGKTIKISEKELSNFIVYADSKNKVNKMVFIISYIKNYKNSGYEQFEVDFTWKEIEKYISKSFLKLL